MEPDSGCCPGLINWKDKRAEKPGDMRTKKDVRSWRGGKLKVGRLRFQKVAAGELLQARQEPRRPLDQDGVSSMVLG